MQRCGERRALCIVGEYPFASRGWLAFVNMADKRFGYLYFVKFHGGRPMI